MWNNVKCKPNFLPVKLSSGLNKFPLTPALLREFRPSTAIADLFQYHLLCLLESYSSVPLYAASLSVKTNGKYWKTLAGWMNHCPFWNWAAHLVTTRLRRCFVATSKAAWRTLIPDSKRRERAGEEPGVCHSPLEMLLLLLVISGANLLSFALLG